MEWWYEHMLQTYKAVASAAINSFGLKLINPLLPKIAHNLLGDQILEWGHFSPTLNKQSSFNLNWALTHKPHTHDGMIDLAFLFDLGPQ